MKFMWQYKYVIEKDATLITHYALKQFLEEEGILRS